MSGRLIVNADDWGRDVPTTDRIFECVQAGVVSAASAMVFMEDSERAASMSRTYRVDVGLHLNFTSPFTAKAPEGLQLRQSRVMRYLRAHRLAPAFYNPLLRSDFEYLVREQIAEFTRLYGYEPQRIDGHHHMHLSANVLRAGLLPPKRIVRRNFYFAPGEKSWFNRWYRAKVDALIQRQYKTVDFLFNMPPMEPQTRLLGIIEKARTSRVELETHPINPGEYEFLMGGALTKLAQDCPIAPSFSEN